MSAPTTTSRVSPHTSFVLSPFRACFTPEQSTVKATLLFDGVVEICCSSYQFQGYVTEEPTNGLSHNTVLCNQVVEHWSIGIEYLCLCRARQLRQE